MQVSLENTSTLGRRLAIQVPADQLLQKYRAKLSETAKSAKIDGFRPGHVSQALVEQRFGKSLRQEVLSKAIEETLQQAVRDHALRIAGQPSIDDSNFADCMKEKTLNRDLNYSASFEVFPSIELAPHENIRLTKKTVNISEADIDTRIEQLRQAKASWITVERPAAQGDRVTIRYTSLLEGKAYEGSEADDISVELGSEKFIEGFEAGLIGKSAGERLSLDLVFPAEWRLKTLAGKPVHFDIEIKTVQEKQVAALDAEFAKSIAAASVSLADIRQAVRESLDKQVAAAVQTALREQMTDELLSANPVTLPQVLVEEEKRALHAELHRGEDGEAHACTAEHGDLQAKAERRVALSLLLLEVIRQENLSVDNKRVRSHIREIAENFGNNSYIEDMYLRSEKLLRTIQERVLTEQALDCLIEKAQLETAETMLKELLQW